LGLFGKWKQAQNLLNIWCEDEADFQVKYFMVLSRDGHSFFSEALLVFKLTGRQFFSS
jgi:hypothetical protein